MDYDGQVAIVTGAGRGIGRAHALGLAARGAAVVVNDLGVEINGAGGGEGPAAEVVREIEATGGRALASTHDVSDPEGGRALVAAATEQFGRLDVVIHNAGIVTAGPIADQPLDDIRSVIGVHLFGAYHVLQPAWACFAEQSYGRVVLTTSGALFGHPLVHAYASAKLGVVGLVKSLHQEAVLTGLDVRVNALAPIGATRMARDEQKARWGDLMDPDAVAAVALYLASRECAVSGEAFHGGGSHMCRIFLGQTRGWAKGEPGVTPEEFGAHLDDVMALPGFRIPGNTNESTDFLYEVATGKDDHLSGEETLPDAYRKVGQQ